jgi:hypothetical protein
MDLHLARQEYEELGIDTIPLRPGTKDAMRRHWQTRDPWTLWRGVPSDANIGLRGGGDAAIAFLDCDEKKRSGTFENAVAWMSGLGYQPGDYPLIQTASQVGRQIYVAFSGDLPGNSRNLASDFGAGEFRYGPGAYVTAPPSRVGDNVYTLLAGSYHQLPRVTLVDVIPILGNKDVSQAPADSLSTIPRRALALLNGRNVENFRSRSEAEQSLIASLVNAGHSFESVLDLFLRYPCAGKFAELRDKSESNAIRWLHHSYDEAVQWTSENESKTRQTIAAMRDWAESRPWPGRTGATDRAVFIAHCQIAYRAGRLVYAASCRDLAELAGVSSPTASIATSRICSAGLVSIDTPAVADLAVIYRLDATGQTLTLPKYTTCEEVLRFVQHDAFRNGNHKAGLGKSGGLIWEALRDGPATEKELANRTGRGVRTVKRRLTQMSRLVDTVTGEFIPMVEKIDGQWRALDGVDLDHVALVVGTAGAGERQQERHSQERRAHRRMLGRWRDQLEKADPTIKSGDSRKE